VSAGPGPRGASVYGAVVVAVVAVVGSWTGCADLPEPGSCGNGIVEPGRGESCDDGGESARCDDACRLVCLDQDESPPAGYVDAGRDPEGLVEYCPRGFTCGVDDVCRAPSGRFSLAGDVFAVDGQQVEAGDVDGDQVTDLIVVSATSIEVRYGSADAAFATSDSLSTPTITGHAVALDVANAGDDQATSLDGQVDVLAPGDGGLLEFVAKDGHLQTEVSLDPIDVSALTQLVGFAPPFVPVTVPDAGGWDRTLIAFVGTLPTGVNALIAGDPLSVSPFFAYCPLGVGGAWRLVDTLGVAIDGSRFAVAAQDGAKPIREVCVFTADLGQGLVADGLQLPPGLAVEPDHGQLVFADLDGGCPDLVVPEAGSRIYVARSGGTCRGYAFDASPQSFVAAGATLGYLAGAVDVDGGRAELALGGSLWKMTPTPSQWAALASFSLPDGQGWHTLASGDFDGNGRPGFVATRRSLQDGKERNDLDLVRVLGTAPDGKPLLQRQILETASPVTAIAGGDFNGDGVRDVAVVQAPVAGQSSLGVAYGRAGTVPAGVTFIDDFRGALVVTRIGTTDSTFSLRRDGLDDLGLGLVVGSDPDFQLLAGVVFGTPTESLAAPQWAATQGQSSRPALEAIAALPAASGVIDEHDLALFTRDAKWLWPAVGVGTFDAQAMGSASSLVPGQPELAVAAVHTLDGAVALVGVSDVGTVAADLPSTSLCSQAPVATRRGRPALRAVDLDGVPGDELLIANRDSLSGEIYLADALPSPCTLSTPTPMSALAFGMDEACGDLAPIQTALGADGTLGLPELAAVCVFDGPVTRETALVVLRRTDGATGAVYAPEPPTQIAVPGHPFAVVPGDFNGDGVTDVVIVTKVGSLTTAQLVLQCADPDPDCGP